MSNLTDFYANANRQLPLRWVSGTFYAFDADAWSPISGHLYRRIIAGGGTTDPSADSTNWKLIGPGGIKSRQSGVTSTGTNHNCATTVTLSPAVNPAACRVTLLGVRNGGTSSTQNALAGSAALLELTDSTTLTIKRGDGTAVGAGMGIGSVFVAWEVVEYWK